MLGMKRSKRSPYISPVRPGDGIEKETSKFLYCQAGGRRLCVYLTKRPSILKLDSLLQEVCIIDD